MKAIFIAVALEGQALVRVIWRLQQSWPLGLNMIPPLSVIPRILPGEDFLSLSPSLSTCLYTGIYMCNVRYNYEYLSLPPILSSRVSVETTSTITSLKPRKKIYTKRRVPRVSDECVGGTCTDYTVHTAVHVQFMCSIYMYQVYNIPVEWCVYYAKIELTIKECRCFDCYAVAFIRAYTTDKNITYRYWLAVIMHHFIWHSVVEKV